MDVDRSVDPPKIIAKEISKERLAQLTTTGRGRLLHPKSALANMAHPWEEGKHAPDTTTVPEGQTPLLSVRDLKVHFPIRKGVFLRTVGYVKAVDGIGFDVYRAQTLGLVGESGCAKTPAGRAILRLIEPDAGRVLYDGVDLATLGGAALRKMRRKL